MKFQELLNYSLAINIGLSVLCFLDILFRFKRSTVLKWSILVFCFSIGLWSFGGLWEYHVGYNRLLSAYPTTFSAFAGLFFFSVIYSKRSSILVSLIFALALFLQISNTIYFKVQHGIGLDVDLMRHSLSSSTIIITRLIILVLILPIPFSIITRLRKKYNEENVYYQRLRNWSLWVLAVFIIDIVSYVVRLFPNWYLLGQFISSLNLTMGLLIVLYRPEFLNSMSGNLAFLSLFSEKFKHKFDPVLFSKAFFDECFFLHSNADAHDLALKMGWKTNEVSSYVQGTYGFSFKQLVEKQRVDYFIQMVTDKRSEPFNLDELASASGFESRQELQRCFKQFHGGTPSEFILLHSELN